MHFFGFFFNSGLLWLLCLLFETFPSSRFIFIPYSFCLIIADRYTPRSSILIPSIDNVLSILSIYFQWMDTCTHLCIHACMCLTSLSPSLFLLILMMSVLFLLWDGKKGPPDRMCCTSKSISIFSFFHSLLTFIIRWGEPYIFERFLAQHAFFPLLFAPSSCCFEWWCESKHNVTFIRNHRRFHPHLRPNSPLVLMMQIQCLS